MRELINLVKQIKEEQNNINVNLDKGKVELIKTR